MIKRIVILLILISCKTTKQSETEILSRSTPVIAVPYVIKWIAKNETFVVSYRIQKSKNNKNWTTIGEAIKPVLTQDSSVYNITLPKTSIANYYRVLATMKKGTFNTLSIYLINTNSK